MLLCSRRNTFSSWDSMCGHWKPCSGGLCRHVGWQAALTAVCWQCSTDSFSTDWWVKGESNYVHTHNCMTTPVSGTRTVRNTNLICHPHCSQIPHKHSQPSSRAYHSTSRSNTNENLGETTERNIKNPTTRTQTFFKLPKFWIWCGRWLIAGPLSLTPLSL